MDTQFTEAPASWNTTYITPDGWVCTLTLRNGNGIELLNRATTAMNHLQASGCKPHSKYGNGSTSSNGNGNSHPALAHPEESFCIIHNCSMTQKTRGNQYWYSHALDDGSWCKGK